MHLMHFYSKMILAKPIQSMQHFDAIAAMGPSGMSSLSSRQGFLVNDMSCLTSMKFRNESWTYGDGKQT